MKLSMDLSLPSVAVMGRRGSPLDGVPGVWIALSLRRLLSTQTGPVIRVRRDSDNAEANFGFGADGWLNTSALLAWCGSASGYVTTWWDVAGNAYANATASEQPKIISAGVLYTAPNGRPRVQFDFQKLLLRDGVSRAAGPIYTIYMSHDTGNNSSAAFSCRTTGTAMGDFGIVTSAVSPWGVFLAFGNGSDGANGPYIQGPIVMNSGWRQQVVCLDAVDPMIRRNKVRLASTLTIPGTPVASTATFRIFGNIGYYGEAIFLQDAYGVSAIEADQYAAWMV